MGMLTAAIVLWLCAFALNLLWEFGHCRLYRTCRQLSPRRRVRLLTTMSAKDAALVVVFYLLTAVLFGTADITSTSGALLFFSGLGLIFAAVAETVSIRLGRWEYTPAMPTVLGVGLSPLLELVITGLTAVIVTFHLLPRP